MNDSLASFEQLLQHAVTLDASDLHLSAFCLPLYRVNGELQEAEQFGLLQPDQLSEFKSALLPESSQDQTKKSVDIAVTSGNSERFRINAYRERGSDCLAIRWLKNRIDSFAELGLPDQIAQLALLNNGLVLITGATGSGKSTTLAALVNAINNSRRCHILTIEDPIEFVHDNYQAMVHQRELGIDTGSFAQAVRDAMRQDPDVILIGEMRDRETIRAALTAAETGHLVFSTLHTNDAVGVIDRIIGLFSAQEQSTIRLQLAQVLRAVVTQTLALKADTSGRVPVNEILLVNHAVGHLIREHRPEQIRSTMETGRALGNQTLDYALAIRVANGDIEYDTGKQLAQSEKAFTDVLQILRQRGSMQREPY